MEYTDLGYDSYDQYLAGPEWQEIRRIKYALREPYRCRICWSRGPLLVHKRSYAFLTPDFFRDLANRDRRLFAKILVYLCRRCNHKVHFYDSGERVPLDYLFLNRREDEVYRRWDMVARRAWRLMVEGIRNLSRFLAGFSLRSKSRRTL